MALTGRGRRWRAATGVEAVALNVTATQAGAPGFLTVYPCGEARPATSTVNYAPGPDVANMAQVAGGCRGQVCIYTMSKVDVVVDVLGWYGDGATSGYKPLVAGRAALDTRYGIGIGGRRQAVPAGGVQPAHGSRCRRRCPTTPPASCSTSPTRSPPPTATSPSTRAAGAVPPSSNLDYRAGTDVANQAVAGIGADGRVCVTSFATSHVVADVLGWFGAGRSGAVRAVAAEPHPRHPPPERRVRRARCPPAGSWPSPCSARAGCRARA